MPFQVYKKKQGQWVRWGTFICVGLLLLFGTYRLYTTSFPDKVIKADNLTTYESFTNWIYNEYVESYTIPFVDIKLPAVTPRLLISLFVGFALLFITYTFCFHNQRTSEFLIDTESEMRKVSWPTNKEVVNSSLVVIVTIVILAVYLFGVDIILYWLFQRIFGLV